MLRKLVTYFALILLIFGTAGFIFNDMVGIGAISIYGELPICNIQGVVEKNDKIYIGLGFYNRVQIYDLNGNYAGYKNTDNRSKDFYFSIDSNGEPKIEVTYNKDAVKALLKDFLDSNCLGADCISYKIERQIPLQIVCYCNGNKSVTIKQSFFMSLWSGPVYPWSIGLLGVIIFCLANIFQIGNAIGSSGDKSDKWKAFFQEVF